ncbi:MAG: hypothetical protein M1816_004968 [Peltula sp. TS41687]|nr:MAG: hypothetical protein M1816_004968 [Peltula sp. TS41687]
MRQSIFTTVAALLLPTLGSAKPLPPCGPTTTSGCVCPPGAVFQNSTTYATIGARFPDVQAIAGSFHDVSWMGLTIAEKTGRPDKPGATRKFIFGQINKYEIIEQLFETKVKKDSSHMKFGEINQPVEIPAGEGSGTLMGFWNYIDFTQERGYGKEYQTSVEWGSYRCVIGAPFDYVNFFEGSLKNLTSVLQTQGKLHGHSSTPYTVDNTRPHY